MRKSWGSIILLALASSCYSQSPTNEQYEAGGFSNFWDESIAGSRLGSIRQASHPAQVQGIIHSYLRDNPAGFFSLIPHVKDMSTWATVGAFANTILEEGIRREQDQKEVEKLLVQNTPKDLVGAAVGPILRHSTSPSDSAVRIILDAPDTIQALNALVLLLSWEELRPLISRAVQLSAPEQRTELTARVQAWYHQ
jgi:hypothetical protein